MFDVAGFDIASRLVVAAAYLTVTVLCLWQARVMTWPWKGWYWAASLVTGMWSAWYVALAFLNPPLAPWGVLNRMGHLPLAALFLVAVYFRRREYDWVTQGVNDVD